MEVRAWDLSKRSSGRPSADVKIWFKLSMKLGKGQSSFLGGSRDAICSILWNVFVEGALVSIHDQASYCWVLPKALQTLITS